MTLFDGPPDQKRCFVYCGDDRCNCESGPRGRLLSDLPKPTADQIEYIEALQVSVSDYDPDEMVRGRKPPFEAA